MFRSAAVVLSLAAAVSLHAQETTMSFKDYDPQSTLVVPQHPTPRAKYPFIDVHNHQEHDMDAAEAAGIVGAMDAMNMAVMVNLSGGSGDFLKRRMAMLSGR